MLLLTIKLKKYKYIKISVMLIWDFIARLLFIENIFIFTTVWIFRKNNHKVIFISKCIIVCD